jgi:hypothetical protein
MSLDTLMEDMYGLGVVISTVFKILGDFLIQGRWSLSMSITYIPSDIP